MKIANNILALDTPFGEISAAILKDSEAFLTRSDRADDGKTRSTTIVPILSELLERAGLSWEELDLLALGAGPGAFTGLRIAASTLAGINSGLKLPILHLSSLAITARQASTAEATWVIEDARAGEAFIGCYRTGKNIHEERCASWQEVLEIAPARFACHNNPAVEMPGWNRLPLSMSRSEALLEETEHAVIGANIDSLPIYPSPVYLQLSQAERTQIERAAHA
ncbi:MAG: tRNA (adenosine(37)-N6)-threonylcarbamoyltransferase complex dimerization subunit type 1 TsaB [Mariprofundus sp.]